MIWQELSIYKLEYDGSSHWKKINSKINLEKDGPRYRAVFHCSTLRSSYSLENHAKMTLKSNVSVILFTILLQIFVPIKQSMIWILPVYGHCFITTIFNWQWLNPFNTLCMSFKRHLWLFILSLWTFKLNSLGCNNEVISKS